MTDDRVLNTYLQARAADTLGSSTRAAESYAVLLTAMPDDVRIARRAFTGGLLAGDRVLSVRAAITLERLKALPPEGRFLLLADAVADRDWKRATAQLDIIDRDPIFGMLSPVPRAWLNLELRRGNPIALLEPGAVNPAVATYAAEHYALMLLATGKIDEGMPALTRLADGAGGRATRLRIAAAATLAKRGKRSEARALLSGDAPPLRAAAQLLEREGRLPGPINDAASGLGEFLVRLAADVAAQDARPVATHYARIASFVAPENSETWLVTSDLLGDRDEHREAIAALDQIRADDPFAELARENRIRLLAAAGSETEALEAARRAAAMPTADASDWSRLAELLNNSRRFGEAADAYGRALALPQQGATSSAWVLHLMQGAALEQADRWPEAKAALEAAYKLAPGEPVVLNHLGYSQLERRENVEAAQRLIEQASALQPNDAAITDSLGWAYFLRGRTPQAIPLLERAAAASADDPAIHEHLGDAYYTAGRRYEARFAWQAALAAAEEQDARRLRSKIDFGLTPETASP